jgi:hypothetical protein
MHNVNTTNPPITPPTIAPICALGPFCVAGAFAFDSGEVVGSGFEVELFTSDEKPPPLVVDEGDMDGVARLKVVETAVDNNGVGVDELPPTSLNDQCWPSILGIN